MPGGVAAVLDAAVIGRPVLAAVRDGGQVAAVRPFRGETDRTVTVRLVLIGDYLHAGSKLAELAGLVAAGKLTLRVAGRFRPNGWLRRTGASRLAASGAGSC